LSIGLVGTWHYSATSRPRPSYRDRLPRQESMNVCCCVRTQECWDCWQFIHVPTCTALGARTGALVNMTLPAGGVAMVATVILELSSIFNAVLNVCKHGHSDVKLALYWRHKQLFGALVVLLSRSKQPEPERAGRQPRCHATVNTQWPVLLRQRRASSITFLWTASRVYIITYGNKFLFSDSMVHKTQLKF